MRYIIYPILMMYIFALAASEPPSPTPAIGIAQPKANASNKWHDTDNDQRSTKQSPLVIESVPPPRDEAKEAEDRDQHKEEATINRGIRYYTGLAALFTLVLAVAACVQVAMFWRQLKYMKTALEDGTKVAAAAEKNANAVINAERAYLFVEILLSDGIRSSPSGLRNELTIRIWNNGKTPAEIVKLRGYAVVQKDVPQELLSFPGSESTLPPGYGLAAARSWDNIITCNITNVELGNIERLYETLFVVGSVTYKDIFGEERITSYCWFYRHEAKDAKFLLAPNSKLNYRT